MDRGKKLALLAIKNSQLAKQKMEWNFKGNLKRNATKKKNESDPSYLTPTEEAKRKRMQQHQASLSRSRSPIQQEASSPSRLTSPPPLGTTSASPSTSLSPSTSSPPQETSSLQLLTSPPPQGSPSPSFQLQGASSRSWLTSPPLQRTTSPSPATSSPPQGTSSPPRLTSTPLQGTSSSSQSSDAALMLLTKKGLPRKRKRSIKSPLSKKIEKIKQSNLKLTIKESCNKLCCSKDCSQLSEDQRIIINKKFIELAAPEKKWFIYNHITTTEPLRRRSDSTLKTVSVKYSLPSDISGSVVVCKKMFLTTLGFKTNNDKVVRNIVAAKKQPHANGPKEDNRGKTRASSAFDKTSINEHIESYNPTISHYRREHAPNVRYLPSDVTIVDMHKNYVEKEKKDISYELYRKLVAENNISFTKLGHEECWSCEKRENHEKVTSHSKTSLVPDCEECNIWKRHNEKSNAARHQYKEDSLINETVEQEIVSVDLQKVIMLPRCDMFKEIIFTPRIIAFNESFVPLGKNKQKRPVAIIWNEAISGRSKEDIISTFYNFIKHRRDAKSFVFWLDNCAAQNKNWTLFSFLVYIVNCPEFNIQEVTLKFFEPGHTFMSADSFHHQVEYSLQKQKKVYDMTDFQNCVEKSNSGKVEVINMKVEDFFEWKDDASQYKLKQNVPRIYLNEMVEVKFTKKNHFLAYKKSFLDTNYINLNFLKAKVLKSGILKAKAKQIPRGISSSRKQELIKKLSDILPANRLVFWKTLPENPTD